MKCREHIKMCRSTLKIMFVFIDLEYQKLNRNRKNNSKEMEVKTGKIKSTEISKFTRLLEIQTVIKI